MTGIYKITNLTTKDFYIGKSKHIEKRWKQHFDKHYGARHSAEFQRCIDEYGRDGFSFEVLEECEANALDERERYYIAELKPAYNTVTTGHSVSETTRAKISKALTGRKQSPETVKKRREALLEKHKTSPQTNEKHRKLVGCEGVDMPFESVKGCASFLGVDASTVTHALKKGHRVKGHKVWYVV